MAARPLPSWRFVSFNEAEVEMLPGKTHYWYNKPGLVQDTNLMFVRAHLLPGEAHSFHHHPQMEEILYDLSSTAEQWEALEKRLLYPGVSVFMTVGIVLATIHVAAERMDYPAVYTQSSHSASV